MKTSSYDIFIFFKKVILASWYRIYTKIMDLIGIQTKICWTVTRGEGLSPIESCEGELLSCCLVVCWNIIPFNLSGEITTVSL